MVVNLLSSLNHNMQHFIDAWWCRLVSILWRIYLRLPLIIIILEFISITNRKSHRYEYNIIFLIKCSEIEEVYFDWSGLRKHCIPLSQISSVDFLLYTCSPLSFCILLSHLSSCKHVVFFVILINVIIIVFDDTVLLICLSLTTTFSDNIFYITDTVTQHSNKNK